jgi:hypothetical protein
LNPDQQTPDEQYEAPCAVDIETDGSPTTVAAMAVDNSPPTDN